MSGFKLAREKNGLKQKELAAAINVDRSTIAKWETGASHPRVELLPKIASVLNCTVDDLLR